MAWPDAAIRRALRDPALDAAGLCAQASRLAQEAAQAEGAGATPLPIGLAGDMTLDFVAQAVACAAAAEGDLARVHLAPFGALAQACLDPASALRRMGAQVVVLVPAVEAWLPPLPPDTPAGEVDAERQRVVSTFSAMWDALLADGCRVVQQTLVPPSAAGRGLAERRLASSVGSRVRALNDALLEAAGPRVAWVDAQQLAERVGLAQWEAPALRAHARLPFHLRHLPAWMRLFQGVWRGLVGCPRKVLVLDLDDTLWGGTIGDAGVEGIALGPDHGARGEAFAQWQAYLRHLAERGVILAVCSKNDPAIAATGLAHPAGCLRQADFAAFECSWSDKAQGLRRVAAEIGVGLDALVLADDNPAECAWVREALPDVGVVDLGTDPAGFIARLEAGHWFDQQVCTAEDFGRARSYEARSQLQAAQAAGTDLEAFLAGLAMRGRCAPAQPGQLDRLAQMELKTSQFNLMTPRLTATQLAAWMARDDAVVLTLQLADRFADHGLVGSLVACEAGGTVRIVSWLLSCRVFGRTAEACMLQTLATWALRRGARALVGTYAPTDRNAVVADLYPRMGFVAEPGVAHAWRFELASPLPWTTHIETDADAGATRVPDPAAARPPPPPPAAA